MGRDNVGSIALDQCGDGRLKPCKRIACQACPVAGLNFNVAPEQEEKGEHANGLKVHFLAAKDGYPRAGEVGESDGNGNRHIHGQMPAADIPLGIAEKRCSAEEHHGGSDQKAEPAKEADELGRQLADQFEIKGKRQHHALERTDSGNGEADEHGPMLGLERLFRLVCLVGAGGVAELVDRDQQVTQPSLIRGPDQSRTLSGMVYREGVNTGLLLHMVFKQPDTGGTGDATNQQLRFLCAFYRCNKRLLNQRVIKLSDSVQFRRGQLLWGNGRFGPEIIEPGETLAANGLAHRFAALAAEVTGRTFELEGDGRLTVRWLTAVKAIQPGQPWADPPALTVIPSSAGSQASPFNRHSLAGPRRS